MKKVLFIDDQLEDWLDLLLPKLRKFGWHVAGEENPEKALDRIKDLKPDAVLLDVMFPANEPNSEKVNLGKPTLERIHKKYPSLPVVMLTTTLADAGLEIDQDKDFIAADYIFAKNILSQKSEGFDPFETLAKQLDRACSRAAEKQSLDEQLGFIIGETKNMRQMANDLLRFAPMNSNVLICGESGTGKELISKALHNKSPRANRPLIAVNIAAIPKDLVESELFGIARNVATGVAARPGKFELACGGTLFLDEIGDMPPDTQAKVLRALQEREIYRVGGDRPIQLDIRLVSATSRNIPQMIKEEKFREDLYYRINTVPLSLPPLRKRKGDIPALFRHFVMKLNQKLGLGIMPALRDDVGAILKSYEWPGNIREFENVIEAAMVKANTNILTSGVFAGLPQFDQEQQAEPNSAADSIVKDMLSGASGWEELKETNGELRRSVLISLIEQITEREGKRPTGEELASLLGTSRNNFARVFSEAGLFLKDFKKN